MGGCARGEPDVKETWQKVRQFLVQGVWDIELGSVPRLKRLLVKTTRVGHLVVRGFREDELALHAAALTFTTLMSLVPLLAFVFSIWKGVGGEEKAVQWLTARVADMPEQFQLFVDELMQIVENTSFFALGGTAVLLLLFTVIRMLSSIEASFNRVWGVAQARPLFRKVTDYISTLVVVCFFIMASATFSLDAVVSQLGVLEGISRPLLRLTPLITTWIAFGFLYAFMPNTRVRLGPTILSGLAGAVLWMGWQKFFISTQVGVFRYNQIFGTFASIPIFLLWLFVCWVIVLIGVEIAFALQNSSTIEIESVATRASMDARLKLALAVVIYAARALHNERETFDSQAFARRERVSVRLLNDILDHLQQCGLLAAVSDEPGRYVLTRAPETIRVHALVNIILQDGVRPETLGIHRLDAPVQQIVSRLETGLDEGFGRLTVADILRDESPRDGDAAAS